MGYSLIRKIIWGITLITGIVISACYHQNNPLLVAPYSQQGKPITLEKLTTGTNPAWAPDSNRIAYNEHGIWVLDLISSEKQRLTTNGTKPTWGPDGNHIAYVDDGLWVIEISTKKKEELATTADGPCWVPKKEKLLYTATGIWLLDLVNNQRTLIIPSGINPCWLPGSGLILFEELDASKVNFDIWQMSSSGGEKKRLIPNATEPASSPDGKYLLYTRGGIWLTPITGEWSKQLTVYGRRPRWSPDGKNIIFCHHNEIWLLGSPLS